MYSQESAKSMNKSILYGVFLLFPIIIFSQVKIKFVIDDMCQNPIKDTHILIDQRGVLTNEKGIAEFLIKKGKYKIEIKHIAYKTYEKEFSFFENKTYKITLQENAEALQEVVITAKEKEGITTTSVINKKAMAHLQPSSFSDLVSLLPGKTIQQPLLNYSNHLKLREVGVRSQDYESSSLGIAFNIDGVPINTNANLQETVGLDFRITPSSYGSVDGKRNTVRSGVDMRSISTDGIEKVEIIRGIASAKYGDLTNGLVKIKRKKGFTKWTSRLKSDGFSKLLYVGKGFYFDKPNITLNIGLDYLNAKADPRNSYENYKRYTASVRVSKVFEGINPITWDLNLDYIGTIDEEKFDPDTDIKRYDFYKSSYQNVRISNKFDIDFTDGFLKNINFTTSLSQSYDEIKQQRFVQLKSASGLAFSTEEGEYYGIFMDPKYVSNLLVDGKPLDIFSDLSAIFKFDIAKIKNNITTGINYSYSKNNGLGQVYDLKHPPSEDMRTRPRAFKDVPEMQSLAFYIEDKMTYKIAKTKLTFQAGIRANSLVGLDKKYAISNKIYLAPRLNFKIDFPKIEFKNDKALAINLSAGYGEHRKFPTLSMLYPQKMYRDYEQLNYYHPKKEFRQIHFKTYVFSPINYDIKPALNLKKELRLGFKYDYHSLYMTFFLEKNTSEFRRMTDFHKIFFKKYDASNLDHNNITSAPRVENLPYKIQNALVLESKESNGSAIDKKGIEFQYIGKRFENINTRFTLNGAWFQTRYYNSLPVYRFSETPIISGRRHYNLGVYAEKDDYLKENFRSSLTADTYLQKLGLITSLRLDMNWFYLSKIQPTSGVPTHYIDEEGMRHPYTEKEKKDIVLQWLVKSQGYYRVDRVPFSLRGHLKISKKFYKYFTLSMYVNNLFTFYEDYYVNGIKVNRKGANSPYFGMEMNIRF